MSVEVMERRAAENRYLHRGFHNHLNLGVEYLYSEYGAAALEEYLIRLANGYYRPVVEKIQKEGISAVREAFSAPYKAEDAENELSFQEKKGELIIRVAECPAVRQLKETNTQPSEIYPLTTSVVWAEICRQANLGYAMLYYIPETGAAAHLFFERKEGAQ